MHGMYQFLSIRFWIIPKGKESLFKNLFNELKNANSQEAQQIRAGLEFAVNRYAILLSDGCGDWFQYDFDHTDNVFNEEREKAKMLNVNNLNVICRAGNNKGITNYFFADEPIGGKEFFPRIK